jgi:hypothetical protein
MLEAATRPGSNAASVLAHAVLTAPQFVMAYDTVTVRGVDATCR